MKLRDGETCSKTFCGPEVPGGSVVKNLSANAGDVGDLVSMLGLGRSSGGGNGSPLHWSRELHGQRSLAATVCRVIKSRTQLSAHAHTHTHTHAHTHTYTHTQQCAKCSKPRTLLRLELGLKYSRIGPPLLFFKQFY